MLSQLSSKNSVKSVSSLQIDFTKYFFNESKILFLFSTLLKFFVSSNLTNFFLLFLLAPFTHLLTRLLHFRRKPLDEPHDACRVHGSLTLNKVSGNFHIAAGKSVPLMRGHAHLTTLFDDNEANFSHRIGHYSHFSQCYQLLYFWYLMANFFKFQIDFRLGILMEV